MEEYINTSRGQTAESKCGTLCKMNDLVSLEISRRKKVRGEPLKKLMKHNTKFTIWLLFRSCFKQTIKNYKNYKKLFFRQCRNLNITWVLDDIKKLLLILLG